jgi:replication factor C subunit 2/4
VEIDNKILPCGYFPLCSCGCISLADCGKQCANYASRIIDPVASRCSKFRFRTLRGPDAVSRLEEILKIEGVTYEDGVIEKVLQTAEGDLRRSLNLLQSAATLIGAGPVSDGPSDKAHRRKPVLHIDDDDQDEDEGMLDVEAMQSGSLTSQLIDEISGVIPASIIEDLVAAMRKGPGRNYKELSSQVTDIVANGFSAHEVLSSLFSRLVYAEDVDDKKKNQMTQVFSEMDKRLIDGSEEHLICLDLVLQCSGIMAK